MAAHGKPKLKPPGAPAPPPPPTSSVAEAKKGFMRRMFPFLLAVNVFVGAYVVVRTYYKDSPTKAAAAPSAATADKSPPEPVLAAAPARVFPPIPDDEQRRLYRWMLEEKRKVRPRDAAERRRLDGEKALLKEIIRADSLPRL